MSTSVFKILFICLVLGQLGLRRCSVFSSCQGKVWSLVAVALYLGVFSVEHKALGCMGSGPRLPGPRAQTHGFSSRQHVVHSPSPEIEPMSPALAG